MTNTDPNNFYFDRKNYFLRFIPHENHNNLTNGNENSQLTINSISRNIRHALEYFVDDLRRDRNKTIERFLNESTLNDIFRSLAQLLLNDDDRICGNSAYIIGSAVEFELGLKRFLTIFSQDRTANTVDIIRVLCQLLTHSDSECAMNAAGTLGTICGSKEGRDLILNHACISQMIINTSELLSSTNPWISSNAALVLARITVEELGCQAVLTHSKHREILNKILVALDVSDPGRSTNAAFAIGRLIEGDEGKKIFIADCGQYKLFDALLLMLEINEEKGVNKNACYALSCLCTTQFGFQLCLQYLNTFHRILLAIETIVSSTDHETVWFALMCLRTIVQYDGANEHICHSKTVTEKLIQIRANWMNDKDIQDEARILWYMIHRNIKPERPKIDECLNNSANISWNISVHSWNNEELQFRIILNDQVVGQTDKTNYQLKDLQPNTSYYLQIQYITPQGENIRSDPVVFRTDDELPPPVNNLHVERTTMTAVRIAWDPPDLTACNSLRGYQTYLNDEEFECTTDCEVTIGALSASTTYQIDICAVSNKGKGPRAAINVTTASAGDCNPAPPTFSVIGRREIHIKWQPPDVIAGRLTRYELFCNRRSIYSGTAQEYHATMLKSDTEYSMEVTAITNEGRFRSKPAKARTLKDEFSSAQRQSLYEPSSYSPPRTRRTDTISSLFSTGLNTTSSKASSSSSSSLAGRRLFKESIGTSASRNTDMTIVHSIQLKSENTSNTRTLPAVTKGIQPRSSEFIKKRDTQRHRTEPISINQLQPQTKLISASVIVPILEIDREPHVRWASPVRYPVVQTTAFRLSTSTKSTLSMNDTRHIERSASISLTDLPSNVSRTQSLSHT